MTSQSHDVINGDVMTSPIDAPQALSYTVPIRHKPLNHLVSEILSIKVVDSQTGRLTIRVA